METQINFDLRTLFGDVNSREDMQSHLELIGLSYIHDIPCNRYTEYPVTVGQIETYGYTVGNTVGFVYNRRNTGKRFRIIEIQNGSMGWGSGTNLRKLLIQRTE